MARAVLARRRRRRDDARPARRDRGGSRGGRLRVFGRRRREAARPPADPGRFHARRRRQHRSPGCRSRLEPETSRLHAAPSRGRRGRAVEPWARRPARRAPEIGETYNQYAGSPQLRDRLAPISSLVGPRRSCSSARRPATAARASAGSRSRPSASSPAPARRRRRRRSSTACSRELGVEDEVLLWNVVPTHPGSETLEPAADARRGRGGVAVPRRADPRTRRDRRRTARSGRPRRAVRPPSVARRSGGVRGRDCGGLSLQSAAGGHVSAAFYEDLQRQAGRDHARVVSRRRRGQDARPARDPDRRHAPRQAEAAVHAARRHGRLRDRRQRREDPRHRATSSTRSGTTATRAIRAGCAAGRSASSSTAGRPRCSASP